MKKFLDVNIDNKASFVFDKNDMIDKVIFKKETSNRTRVMAQPSLSPKELTARHKKKEVIVAAFSLRNGNTVYDAIVYEPIHIKEIEKAFREFVEVNKLDVLYNVSLTPSYSNQPRRVLGNGGYKSAYIQNEYE